MFILQVPLDAKKKKRDMTSAAIREDMQKGNVEMERCLYISLPKDSDHTVHKLGIVSQNIITQAKCILIN